MKELIYLKTEVSELDGKKYNVSVFLDVFNYEILRGTNLDFVSKLKKGDKCLCNLDVKFNRKQKKFVFYVTDCVIN